MRSIKLLLTAVTVVTCAAATAACGAPPKVLVDQAYLGDARTTKVLMRRNDTGQFDQFIRVCDLGVDGAETRCQDTLVLQNVQPGSLY